MKGVEELTSKEKAMIFETEEQHLWWLGNNKDRLGLTWEEVANTLNKRWRKDETEYFTESAYRKKFTYAKEVFDAAIKPETEKTMKDAGTYVDSIRQEREKLYEEKVTMWDARRAYNKTMRDNARYGDTINLLEEAVKAHGHEHLPRAEAVVFNDGNNDLLCCLADIHYGIEFDSYLGKYNPEIAKARLAEYQANIIETGKMYGSSKVYVALLGDLISGNIHSTISIENKENVIKQTMNIASLISDFVYNLSKEFEEVVVGSVSGNHSRMQPKEHAVKDERLDDLVIWYLDAKLEHIENVVICPVKDNIDETIAVFHIRGKDYILAHGDYDSFSEAGMGKLALWLGKIPYAIIVGHKHEFSMFGPQGIRCIRSGSLCGSGDTYTVAHRMRGIASQALCVCTEGGIKAIMPVEFTI